MLRPVEGDVRRRTVEMGETEAAAGFETAVRRGTEHALVVPVTGQRGPSGCLPSTVRKEQDDERNGYVCCRGQGSSECAGPHDGISFQAGLHRGTPRRADS